MKKLIRKYLHDSEDMGLTMAVGLAVSFIIVMAYLFVLAVGFKELIVITVSVPLTVIVVAVVGVLVRLLLDKQAEYRQKRMSKKRGNE